MKPIIGIDQALLTGWAIWNNGDVESGTKDFHPKKGPCTSKELLEFCQWFTELLQTHDPSLVVIEEPVCHGQGGNILTLVGFRTILVVECKRAGVPCLCVHPSKLKVFAAGTGHAKKEAMQAAAKEHFPFYQPQDDPGADEADALCLLLWGMKRPDLGLQTEKPKPKRRAKTK